jgi:hypothetical protein
MRVSPPAPALLSAVAALLASLACLPAAAWQATAMAEPTARSAAMQAPAAAPALSRQQRARVATQDAEIIDAARKVMSLVDSGRIEEVWEGASPTIKRLVPRGEFIDQVASDRVRLGAVLSRGGAEVGRERYAAGGRVPQGEYLNVATPTRFAGQSQPVRELVSFRLDEDRVWRVSGYSVR